ncbi:hypothetical protein Sjap_005555 [Stephania japonica]|uniref:LOB domain-containing protein n=1 Tax=Stephania japonica TaxID=461633 RepID=A0AAP0K6M7_9MAGN
MPPQERAVDHPCAACRTLRRRCGLDCILAPYFPLEDLESFMVVHRIFGASNVVKMLQEVEESKREDAVKSMVYEARARLQDPIYGSAGAIFHLQRHVQDLLLQLQLTKATIMDFEDQRDQLLSTLMGPQHLDQPSSMTDNDGVQHGDADILLDDSTLGYNLIEFPVDCELWQL